MSTTYGAAQAPATGGERALGGSYNAGQGYGRLRAGTVAPMKNNRILVSVALGALALVPSAAVARTPGPVAHAAGLGSKIVLYKSVGGISLGITPKAVEHKLGKPSHTIRVGGKVAEYEYVAKDGASVVSVDFDTNNRRDLADGVFGFASKLHTSKGIHPGSTVAQLKRAYGHALKKFPGGYALNQGTPGASPTTQFAVTGSKVNLIDVQTTFNDD
jgi:hypothetical protein